MRQILIDAYMVYVNNYLSIERWCEHNGLTKEQGEKLIKLAREVHYSEHPDA